MSARVLFCMALSLLSPGSPAWSAQPPADKQQAAPQPARHADGTPNWTGFWATAGGLLEGYRGPSGIAPRTGATPPPAAGGRPRGPFGGYPPLKSPYKERHEEYLKQAALGKVPDPVALCFPPGMPRMMVMTYGMEFLQTPGQIAITSEWQSATRRIWMNLKEHPDPEELDPTYAGHSIGHWEGDTLVIDTVGIRTDVPVDFMGLPHSDKLHVVERIAQTSPGILVNEMTIDDPEVFTAPWKATFTYRYRPDLQLKEFVCLENNRHVGPNGEAVF